MLSIGLQRISPAQIVGLLFHEDPLLGGDKTTTETREKLPAETRRRPHCQSVLSESHDHCWRLLHFQPNTSVSRRWLAESQVRIF